MTAKNQLVDYFDYDEKTDNLKEKQMTGIDFAKIMVTRYGTRASAWRDYEPEITVLMGKNLQTRIDRAIIKQIDRVTKYLGVDKIL